MNIPKTRYSETHLVINRRMPFLLLAATVVLIAALACGSDSPSAPASDSAGNTNEFGFETSVVANANSIYTVDDVANVGWKKSRELPAESLEGAKEVWFGFYQQKNLEVRVYDSHQDAKSLGTGPAEEVVARTRGVSDGGAGPYMKQTTQYGGYGVVGNLVVLCELDVEVCADLAAALEG